MNIEPYREILADNILFSCGEVTKRAYEHMVPEHALGYLISGEMQVKTNESTRIAEAGTIALVRRNQLLKMTKVPPPGGQFRSINIFLTKDMLHKYSVENNITDVVTYTGNGIIPIPANAFIKGYFDSLAPYFDAPGNLTRSMTELKTKEAIELLLRYDKTLKDFLFDLSEPHKIDLEAFMNRNYMYNITTDRFAKLTGRSLAGFKRDFGKVFNTTPGHWLQQKRLSEAYYLIKEKRQKPSDVYLDVGFENLSHFSFAFKKAYGISPSLIT